LDGAKEQQLRPIGLAPAHYAVLAAVAANPGITGAELARELRVSPQNIAGLAGRLASRGLIERHLHERHRQILEMRLTRGGMQVLGQAEDAVGKLEDAIVAILGAPRAEELRVLLNDLATGLEARAREQRV
jgi:DNA-binding MarR family transcriptional regulator